MVRAAAEGVLTQVGEPPTGQDGAAGGEAPGVDASANVAPAPQAMAAPGGVIVDVPQPDMVPAVATVMEAAGAEVPGRDPGCAPPGAAEAKFAAACPMEGLGAPPTAGPDASPAALEEDWKTRAARLARIGGRYLAYGLAGYGALVLMLVFVYRFLDPPTSNLMLYQRLSGAAIDQRWVPIEEISPHLVRAVLMSEDSRFCSHWGIDFEAIGEAIENAADGLPRGASTISMQVTKNLFLWSAKSYVRKAIELPLTFLMELVWPKWRMLEIYLNIAEWGPGVFGAEAAARHHFSKSAARLGPYEAALLAASLPNPMVRDAGDPGPRTARKAGVIQARLRGAGHFADCVLIGRE